MPDSVLDEDGQDEDEPGYVCHPCQSNKHQSCHSWTCVCCSGGDED